jgi:3-hydroxybutyryl-CoA dehydratase
MTAKSNGAPGPATGSWKLKQVDSARMKILALLLADPNPVHLDPEAARRLNIADREVNQGPSNMAMVVNMVMQTWPDAELRQLRVRLLGQVLADEGVEAAGNILQSATFEANGNEFQRLTVQFMLSVDGRGTVAVGEAELERPVDPTGDVG